MSSCRLPPTISKGESCTAPGSSCSIFGTAVVPRVSITPQVSRSVNCSPTRTAVLSVLHQHLMGAEEEVWAERGVVVDKTAVRTIQNILLLIHAPNVEIRIRIPLLG